MKNIHFIGPMGLPSQTYRSFDGDTLERLGIKLPDSALVNGELVFGPDNNHTVEMSNDAADKLIEMLPNEFGEVSDDEVKEMEMELPLTDNANPDPISDNGLADRSPNVRASTARP